MVATTYPAAERSQSQWDQLATKARWERRIRNVSLLGFLILVSIPIILPYFWLLTLAFSAHRDIIETTVLWKSVFILVPGLLAIWLWSLYAQNRRQMMLGWAAMGAFILVLYAVLVGPHLHLDNFRFLIDRNFNRASDSIVAAEGRPGFSVTSFPSVWIAARNSLFIAGLQTVIVTVVASLAAYYISRFQFPLRNRMLPAVLMLHAFPVYTLIIPLFLLLHWINLLDSLWGVMLVLVGIELPFAIFIMKGFFDSVPWDIEMSALTDGASRRQTFLRIVLPQVMNGIIAVSVFSFIRGWEEYVFMLTFLIKNTNWTMSLYMFFVTEENSLGIDYGMVSAVALFYLVPSLIMYSFAQKYLLQMSIGGVKG